MPLQQVLDALLLQLGMLLERRVQVGDVRRMMLVVMDPHRLFVDVRLQGVVVVRKRWDFMRHRRSSFASKSDVKVRTSEGFDRVVHEAQGQVRFRGRDQDRQHSIEREPGQFF